MSINFLFAGPEDAPATILLAHGAGGPMDSPAMATITAALADVGLRVARFEFGYMAERRRGGRRPPPRAETLVPEYETAVTDVPATGRLIIGGKSLGGRVASMMADRLYPEGRIAGVLCIGYPFHSVGRPAQLRVAHLKDIQTPTLICQGTRDPFGSREEVAGYSLSATIELLWLEDGDHDLKPGRASGFTAADHLRAVARTTQAWCERITVSR